MTHAADIIHDSKRLIKYFLLIFFNIIRTCDRFDGNVGHQNLRRRKQKNITKQKFCKPIDNASLPWYNSRTMRSETIRGAFMRVMSEEKLQKLAEFIKQYARDNNGESPSLADIMEYMGMVKSTA